MQEPCSQGVAHQADPESCAGHREVARKDKRERFTALLRHVGTDLLRESYYALKRKAAPGVGPPAPREAARQRV